jgi:hypothetical protein
MPYDYTDAPPPRGIELIPAGTVASLRIHIRPGGVGEDGMLKRSSKGDCEMLDVEYLVVDGQYAKRKFWENLVLDGATPSQQEMALSNRGKLKLILDSALGLKPNDISPEARAARTKSLKEFEGVTFIGKIGIEKGGRKKDSSGNLTGENHPDKNILAAVITPDKHDWRPAEQPPPFNGGGGNSAPSAAPPQAAPPALPVTKPRWAS